MWVVKLQKPIPTEKNTFQVGYFPREKRYKKEAVALVAKVHLLGGHAVMEKK